MELVDTKHPYIKFDKILKKYFALDETGSHSITDKGKDALEEAKKLLRDYARYLNGVI